MELYGKYKFEITRLEWERIFLNFDVQADYNEEVEFALIRFERNLMNPRAVKKKHEKPIRRVIIHDQLKIKPEKIESGIYQFRLNMTAIQGRQFLENGVWAIVAIIQGKFNLVTICPTLGYRVDELSRVFRYGKGKYAYNLSFSIDPLGNDKLGLFFDSHFMKENSTWKKRRYIQEALTFRGKIQRTYMYFVIWLIRIYYHMIAAFIPKKGNKVLFMSETRAYLWGNLKYLNDRIIERGLDKEFKLSYTFRKSVGESNSVFSWVKTVTRVAAQDYIFIDDYAPIFGFFKLSPKTKLIQVWHAGEGFKSVGYSRFGREGSPFPSESCHKAYDYVLTGSKRLIDVYEEVFGIERSAFLPVGMARLDGFLDRDVIENFRTDFYKSYPDFENRKIILFAPTFRGTGQEDAYYDYSQLNLQTLYDFCGDEYVVLFKMHPFVHNKIQIPDQFQSRLFDFAEYPNINDLYYITDILITDYSSNYYEYALMQKPVLFFTYDRERYELIRGVHRSVKEHAPGKVCDTFEELIAALENQDYELEKLNQFIVDNFSEYDGHACDRAIDRILLKKEA